MSPDTWSEEEHWRWYEPTEEVPRPRHRGGGPDSFAGRVYDDLVAHPGSSAREVRDRINPTGLLRRTSAALFQLRSSGRADWTGTRGSLADPPRWSVT